MKKNDYFFIFNLFQNTYERSGRRCKSSLRVRTRFSWLLSLLLVSVIEEDISILNFALLHLSYIRKRKSVDE
jgi:hypothetical protein